MENNKQRITYLNANEAKLVDEKLMSDEYGWRMEQLMELAGLSVAQLAFKKLSITHPPKMNHNVLIYVGPGNNGGDGLVAARHLKLFGYQSYVVYPKQPAVPLYQSLTKQCQSMGVIIASSFDDIKNHINQNNISSSSTTEWPLIIDAIFGFSFKGAVRSPFDSCINDMIDKQKNGSKVLSVDIPSSWDVENGPSPDYPFFPDFLLSLTLPKLCAKYHRNEHWVGGRFVPPGLCETHHFTLPDYENIDEIVRIDDDDHHEI